MMTSDMNFGPKRLRKKESRGVFCLQDDRGFTLPQQSVKAFDKAIAEKRLSEDPEASNFAGKYMWMGNSMEPDFKDTFKNIMTRKYDV